MNNYFLEINGVYNNPAPKPKPPLSNHFLEINGAYTPPPPPPPAVQAQNASIALAGSLINYQTQTPTPPPAPTPIFPNYFLEINDALPPPPPPPAPAPAPNFPKYFLEINDALPPPPPPRPPLSNHFLEINGVYPVSQVGPLSAVEQQVETTLELEALAVEYVTLNQLIGPIAPGYHDKLAEQIRENASELGLDPDEVMEGLDRDAAFHNYVPDGVDLNDDIIPISRSEWNDMIGSYPELRGIYFGGGAIEGPDGNLYPLVVPTVHIDGDRFNAEHLATGGPTVLNHFGEDDRWETLSVEGGPIRYGDKPEGWERVLAFFGGTAGYQPIGGSPLRAGAYEALTISPSGYPTLHTADVPREIEGAPSTLPPVPPQVSYVLVGNNLFAVDRNNLDGYNRATRRAAARQGVVAPPPANVTRVAAAADLAVTLGQGLVTSLRLDDGNNGYYQLVFEQADDGSRRAMLRTYSMTAGNGQINIWPAYVSADENGEAVGTPILYHETIPSLPPFQESANGDYFVVQLPD